MIKNKNFKKGNVTIKDIFLSIVVLIIYFIFGIAAFPNENNINDFNVLYYVVCMLLMVIVIICAYKNELVSEIKVFLKNPIKNILKCFGVFVLLFLIITLGNFVIDQLLGWTKLNSDTLIFPNMKSMFMYTILVLIIYTPFVEGIIFTKTINKIIHQKIIWIIISGFLYGLMQAGLNFGSVLNVVSTIPYIIIGIIVAFIYEKNKNVFYPMFIWLFYYLLQFIIQSSAYWA